MTYTVKEIFYTLQGEGIQAGRPAVFCRFSGCNLWTGREADRATATCRFCDTDFVGVGPDGGKFATAEALAEAVARLEPEVSARLAVHDYGAALAMLAGARDAVDRFFNEVMVMVDDPVLRANRLALLSRLHALMNGVADISRLSVG